MLGSTRTYPVAKSLLIAKIRENREAHVKEYETAVSDFRKAVIEALISQVSERNGIIAAARDGLPFKLSQLIRDDEYPVAPTGHAAEYERVIGLLELTSDTQIEITGTDYQRYIEDDWEWKEDFKNVAMSYSTSERGRGRGRRDND